MRQPDTFAVIRLLPHMWHISCSTFHAVHFRQGTPIMNTDTAIHNSLQDMAVVMRQQQLAALLDDATRARGFVWQLDDLRIDLSRQFLNDAVMMQLQAFAISCGLADKISALFAGEAVNVSEGRAVVHMAQRSAAAILVQEPLPQAAAVPKKRKKASSEDISCSSGRLFSAPKQRSRRPSSRAARGPEFGMERCRSEKPHTKTHEATHKNEKPHMEIRIDI